MILNPDTNQLIPDNNEVSYEEFKVNNNNIVSEYDKAIVSLDVTPYKDNAMLLINLHGNIAFDVASTSPLYKNNKFDIWIIYKQTKDTGFTGYSFVNTDVKVWSVPTSSTANHQIVSYDAGSVMTSIRHDLYSYLEDDYICMEFDQPITSISASGIVIALL